VIHVCVCVCVFAPPRPHHYHPDLNITTQPSRALSIVAMQRALRSVRFCLSTQPSTPPPRPQHHHPDLIITTTKTSRPLSVERYGLYGSARRRRRNSHWGDSCWTSSAGGANAVDRYYKYSTRVNLREPAEDPNEAPVNQPNLCSQQPDELN